MPPLSPISENNLKSSLFKKAFPPYNLSGVSVVYALDNGYGMMIFELS